jgi:ribosome-associated protein
MRPHQPPADDLEELPPSKTKIKKQMHELRDLGEIIANLPKDKLRQLDLPENLFEACTEYKRMTKFGAIKRQMLYIGRLMRDIDTTPILAKLESWNGNSREHTAWLHQVERWRDRLVDEDDALTEFLAAYPAADSQQLRTLIRNAKKEKELLKPPKNFREIFQLLRELIPQP